MHHPRKILLSPILARKTSSSPSHATALRAIPEFVIGDSEAAQSYFWLWFFGGSGGAGVALRQLPEQYANFRNLFTLAEEGPTEGGPTVGLSPLCLFPRDISKADIDKILNNKMTVETMVEQGPKPNFLSERGYLCYLSFVEANKGCNPLAVRAVFDALSTSYNVDPILAQSKLDEFSSDKSPDRVVFKNELLKQKLVGFSSIAFLLFLLGPICGSTCLDALAEGWFPDWPGKEYMPWSLFWGPGFWTVPGYWI